MINKCLECNDTVEKLICANKGISYSAYKCNACGEEIMNMTQAKDYMKQAEKHSGKKTILK